MIVLRFRLFLERKRTRQKERVGNAIPAAPALFYTHMNIFQFNERKKEIKMTSNIR